MKFTKGDNVKVLISQYISIKKGYVSKITRRDEKGVYMLNESGDELFFYDSEVESTENLHEENYPLVFEEDWL